MSSKGSGNGSVNLQASNALSSGSSKAGPEFKSLCCSQNPELVPSRWDLWPSNYKHFMAIKRICFMSVEQNQQKGKHLSFQSIFWFLTTLCRNRTVQDIFFSSVLNLQKFCCCRFQKKLFGGKNETGRKKKIIFEEHMSRLGCWKLFTCKINRHFFKNKWEKLVF